MESRDGASDDTVFANEMTELYDGILGPFMFEPFAREMAARMSDCAGQILEIAAGTGIVTRELDRRLAEGAQISATDLNPPMLERAAARLRSRRVTWRQADALALPFADETFDAVVCQFGAMFYPDAVAGHREAARVLKPGGQYALSVWDDLASNPVAQVVDSTVAARFPSDPPAFLARTPHGHHDKARLRQVLTEAGFREVSIDTVTLPAAPMAADELARGFCQGTPLRHEITARGDLGEVTRAVERALRHAFAAAPIESAIQAHFAMAVR